MSVVAEGRALGEPQRFAIFELLRTAERPLKVSELTDAFSLHHNAIRHHLGVLQAAGLIERSKGPAHGRGRPALEYRVAAGALDRWTSSGPQEELSLMLLELIETGEPARVVGQRAGARLAGQNAADDSNAALQRMVKVTRDLGFEPTFTGVDELTLGRCPFAATASRSREIVCELHRGVAEGVATAVGGQLKVDDLVVADPYTGRCRLLLSSIPDVAADPPTPAAPTLTRPLAGSQ